MKPRSSTSYEAISSSRTALTSSIFSSRSCASSVGATGWSATMRIASIARAFSVAIGARSAVVGVDARQVGGVERMAQPQDLDLAERPRLEDVDQALLVHLEDGEEAHDDLEPLDERRGELAEGDAPDTGQLIDELLHRV